MSFSLGTKINIHIFEQICGGDFGYQLKAVVLPGHVLV